MEILSTVKPDIPKKPEVKIEYNNRSYESYTKNGFADAIPRSIRGPHDRMQQFLNKVDLRKGPIERTVRMIVRLRAPDWNSSTKKNERREFIYYSEDWTGNDWLGIPINPFSEHIEGKCTEVMMKPKLDERTGEHVDNVFSGTRDAYYLPFSKKNVDEIIANSAHSDKDSIKFIIKFGMEDSPDSFQMSTRNQFTYDKFVNWSWDKLKEFQYWPVDDLFNRPKAAKSATNLEFKPS
jgi:hypothetical protein